MIGMPRPIEVTARLGAGLSAPPWVVDGVLVGWVVSVVVTGPRRTLHLGSGQVPESEPSSKAPKYAWSRTQQYRPSTVTQTMAIGELATQTGTPISTLRFYERNGLLQEPARVSGQRRYPPEAAERVAMIRMWRRAGFTVAEVQSLLADRQRLAEWQDLVRAKIAELEAQAAQIERSRAELQHALLCRAEDWTACGWMKAAARSPVEGAP